MAIVDRRPPSGTPISPDHGRSSGGSFGSPGPAFPFLGPPILTSGVTVYAKSFRILPTDSLRLEAMRKDKSFIIGKG